MNQLLKSLAQILSALILFISCHPEESKTEVHFPVEGEWCFKTKDAVPGYLHFRFVNDTLRGELFQEEDGGKFYHNFHSTAVSDTMLEVTISYSNAELLEYWAIRFTGSSLSISNAHHHELGTKYYDVIDCKFLPDTSGYTNVETIPVEEGED